MKKWIVAILFLLVAGCATADIGTSDTMPTDADVTTKNFVFVGNLLGNYQVKIQNISEFDARRLQILPRGRLVRIDIIGFGQRADWTVWGKKKKMSWIFANGAFDVTLTLRPGGVKQLD